MPTILLRFSWISVLLLLLSCRNTPAADQSEKVSPPPAPPAVNQKLYPSLPPERMQELYNSVDYIDFVFYYTNFSMNQADANSIKATLSHVATEVPDIDPSCQPIGSLFFQSKGKELIQAELFYTERCVFYIWLENGRRTYANKMTPNGLKFYQQIFSQNAN